jgi:hypothetical protein
MNNIILEQINFYCDMVNKGKPSACQAIQERYISKATEIIEENKLKVYIEELYPDWKTIWIYKDDYMLEIIKELPKEPKTIFDHWILGKAFGYSDEAIRDFVDKQIN